MGKSRNGLWVEVGFTIKKKQVNPCLPQDGVATPELAHCRPAGERLGGFNGFLIIENVWI